MISSKPPTIEQAQAGQNRSHDPSRSSQPFGVLPTAPDQPDHHKPTTKQRRSLIWLCLLLACIGTSWFAYQLSFVPQPRTFTPDWHNARWIVAGDTSSDPSPVAYFRRSLQFGVIPDTAYITITANQTFRLYVNGIYIGSNTQDFIRGATPQTYMFDIDSTLVTGTNIVGIRITNVDQSTPQLLANISASWGHQNYNYGTDAVWQATQQAALAHPRMSKTNYDWAKPVFDATRWRSASISSQTISYPALLINPQVYRQPLPTSWISAGAGQESYYVRSFSTPTGYDNALLRIVATGEADIFINDHLYARWSGLANVPQVNVVKYLSSNGQPAPYRNGLMLGVYDITPYLHPGSNTIAVHILAPGTTTAKIGLNTQRSAMSLEILAGSAGNYENVVSSPVEWHASLRPVTGWTKANGPASTWDSPQLIGRPGASHTFYLPDSNTPHNTQTVALGPLVEVIGMSIIAVLTFWLLLSLAILRCSMPSLLARVGARHDPYEMAGRARASARRYPYEMASLVFLPALALEALLVALSQETLITQPFPYTRQWGLVLITVVILTAIMLWLHARATGETEIAVGIGFGEKRREGSCTPPSCTAQFTRFTFVGRGFTPLLRHLPSPSTHNPTHPRLWPFARLHTKGTDGCQRIGEAQDPSLRAHARPLWAWMKRNWGILPVFLITALMVLYNPAYEPYWQDELSSYYAARYIMTHGFPAFPSGFIYPKGELFSYLLALIMTIFGTNSPVVTRASSMLLFLASLPIFYIIGSKLFNRRVAWFATTMLAFSPYTLVWSRQTRMYEQAQFMVIIVIGVLYWAIQQRNKIHPIRIAIVCILLAYFSHEEVFITLPAILVCALVASHEGPYGFPSILKKKHWWIPALIAVAIISTQLSLVILSHTPTFGTDQSRRPQLQLTTDNIPYYFGLFFEPQVLKDGPTVWTPVRPLLAVNSILAVLGCVIAFRRKDRRACYCALFLLISTATLVFLFTMQADRYYYPLLPAYYLMSAYGIWTMLHALWIFARPHLALPRITPELPATPPTTVPRLPPLLRILMGGTVALVLASILIVPMLPISNFNLFVSRALGIQYRRHFADYDNVGQYMQHHMQPGDTVISVAPAVIILYEVGKVDHYFSIDRALFLFERNGQLMETTSGSHPLLNQAEFQHVLAQHSRIWLITDNGGYQGGVTKNKRFVFPPPDFQLVYEGYGSGIYFRSSAS